MLTLAKPFVFCGLHIVKHYSEKGVTILCTHTHPSIYPGPMPHS